MSLPAAKLDQYKEENWPSFKGATIVFYSDDQADIVKARELMFDYNLSKATVFPGGYEHWVKLGLPTETGEKPAPENLTFVRVLKPHDVTIEEFKKLLDDPTVVILDVRNDAERATGHFNGSLHIPFEQVAMRYNEIPKDKTVVIHCATGIRSGSAYETLKDKGLKNMKVLNANVKFKDGAYTISE